MLNRRVKILLFFTLCWLLFIAFPAMAQEATPPPTDEGIALPTLALTAVSTDASDATPEPPVVVVNPPGDDSLLELVKQALPWIGAIAITFIVVIGALGHQFIVNLGKSAPVPLREMAISAGESLLKSGETYVESTPIKLDDAALEELKKAFRELVAEIRMAPVELPPTFQTVSSGMPAPANIDPLGYREWRGIPDQNEPSPDRNKFGEVTKDESGPGPVG